MKYIINIGSWQEPGLYLQPYLNKEDYTVFLIEAVPEIFKKLSENIEGKFNNAKAINCAISNYTGEIYFYFDEQNIHNGNYCSHGSVKEKHLIDNLHKEENIKKFKIKCFTLEDFCDFHSIEKKNVEHIFIDVEGHEYEIITSINFQNFNLTSLSYEHVHTDGVKISSIKNFEIRKYLTENGFGGFHSSPWDASDTTAINLKKI